MTRLWSIGLILVTTGQPQHPLAAKPVTVYALLDDTKHEWCGVDDKDRWESEIARVTATTSATIQLVDRHPTVITIYYDDEPGAGDWAARQTYKLNSAGQVVSLETITNVLPGDVSQRETYLRRNGRLVRSSLRFLSLTTKQPLKDKPDWIPSLTHYASASAMPLVALIPRVDEIRAGKSVCVTAPPEPPGLSLRIGTFSPQ